MNRLRWVGALGVLGACGGGGAAGRTAAPEAAPPVAAVQRHLVSGEREPALPPAIKDKLYAEGIREPVYMFKVCVDDAGMPTTVDMKKGSGDAVADDYLVGKLREWRFNAVVPDGEPEPMCTGLMFRYVIGP